MQEHAQTKGIQTLKEYSLQLEEASMNIHDEELIEGVEEGPRGNKNETVRRRSKFRILIFVFSQ